MREIVGESAAGGKVRRARAARGQARAAARAADAAAAALAAFKVSPVGRARAAKAEKRGFLEIELSSNDADPGPKFDAIAELAAVEDVGWVLEHVGYVTTRSDLNYEVRVGIYLFRNTDSPPPPMRRRALRRPGVNDEGDGQ